MTLMDPRICVSKDHTECVDLKKYAVKKGFNMAKYMDEYMDYPNKSQSMC